MAPIATPDVLSTRFKANPFPFYARLRAEAPVYRMRLSFAASPWLITRYDDVVFVLKEGPFSNDILRQRMSGLLNRFTYGDLIPGRFHALGRHLIADSARRTITGEGPPPSRS